MAFPISPASLARAAAAHPWRVVGAWLAALAVAAGLTATLLGGALTSDDDFTHQPESKRADAIAARAFAGERRDAFSADEAVLVRSPRLTAADPAFRRRVEALVRELTALPGVAGTVDAYGAGGRSLVSRDRHTALILVDLRGDVGAVVDLVRNADGDGGFTTLVAGEDSIDAEMERAAERDLARGETYGLALALLVLVVVFGAVATSLVPIAVALAAIVVALGLTALVGQVASLSFFVVNMLVMMGLAVGIDYSLFVVSRVREERRAGRPTQAAIAAAGATASRAVLWSGFTVVLGLLGMWLVPQTIFRSLATGAILVVAVAVAAALTLLPALLALLGDRLDALRLPLRSRGGSGRVWGRIAEAVMRRPLVSLLAGIAFMVALALPVAGITTGSAGVSTLPAGFETKRGFDLLEREFGPQQTSTADVVVAGDVRTPAVRRAIADLRAALRRDPAFGASELAVADDGRVAIVSVAVDGDPVGAAAVAAVRALRDRYLPAAFAGVPAEALVTGTTAREVDFHDIARRYQPIVFAFVLGLSFVLLVPAFRSVVVPATAIAMNLLSVAAAYGLLVLVFQHGVGAGMLGLQQTPTIEAWLPLFLFTVLFGLSMDYHVFLLSRIRERWAATGDTREAVAFGVRSTARIITGAALIMVAVFGGFASGDLVMFQQLGFGLGAAVLLDATVVRTILVPAAMALLGRWNWYPATSQPAGEAGRSAHAARPA